MRSIVATVLLAVLGLTGAAAPALAVPLALQADTVAQEPAVEVPEPEPEDEAEPWTTRYLVPTVLAAMAVVVGLVVVGYLVRLRGRYRVVE